MAFDNDGMLILPTYTEKMYKETMKRRKQRKYRTGVFVTCSRCGYKWERWGLKNTRVRCHRCNTWNVVQPIITINTEDKL